MGIDIVVVTKSIKFSDFKITRYTMGLTQCKLSSMDTTPRDTAETLDKSNTVDSAETIPEDLNNPMLQLGHHEGMPLAEMQDGKTVDIYRDSREQVFPTPRRQPTDLTHGTVQTFHSYVSYS